MALNKYTIKELEDMIKNSENAQKNEEAYRLWKGEGIEKDRNRAIELFLEAAINGYIPAMDSMAVICHNDAGDLKTQDRKQECFWFEQMVKELIGKRFLYHAQNMIDGSYDQNFTEQEINPVLALAAALGNDQAKEYLAVNYASKKNDKESLKKSLYWFYSIKERSGRIERELEKVEEILGLK